MKQVKFYALGSSGEDEDRGSITLDGGTLKAFPEDSAFLKKVLKGKVYTGDEKTPFTTADEDPELFLKSLHLNFRSAYLRASKPEDDAKAPEVKESPFKNRKSLP